MLKIFQGVHIMQTKYLFVNEPKKIWGFFKKNIVDIISNEIFTCLILKNKQEIIIIFIPTSDTDENIADLIMNFFAKNINNDFNKIIFYLRNHEKTHVAGEYFAAIIDSIRETDYPPKRKLISVLKTDIHDLNILLCKKIIFEGKEITVFAAAKGENKSSKYQTLYLNESGFLGMK